MNHQSSAQAELDLPQPGDATEAQLKAERERLDAERARKQYAAREADTIAARDAVAAGLALRDVAMQALDQLLEHWALDVAGEGDETRVHHAMSLAAHEVLSGIGAKVRAHPSAVPAMGDAFTRGATPRQVLSVSQHAARHRVLRSGTNSPGPWSNELTPYLVEIMDALSEHSPVRYVTFMKSSGVGGTEVIYNWIGYVMHHLQNKDLLVVVPSLDLRDRAFNPRLAKMIDESPSLAALAPAGTRNRANRLDLMEYGARARIIKAGANSPDSMRSDHIPYVVCDEVSAFPWDVGGEGDPMLLIDNRQRTYSRAKTLYVSTPLEEHSCRIHRLYLQSDQRSLHVPCPHCGEAQALEWGGADVPHGLKWRLAPAPEGSKEPPRVAAAWYVCRSCGAEIEEKHKPGMLAAGRWIAARPQIKHHRGYHINALYAPIGLGLTWPKIAQVWLDAQGDRAALKAFTNTYLGQVWREEGETIEPASLITRLEPYQVHGLRLVRERGPGLPAVVRQLWKLTAGVDVQKDRLEASIIAWAEGEEAWLVDHIILPGDTTQPDCWAELDAALREAGVQHACVDSGYNTGAVMAWCRTRGWAIPTKGISGPHRPLVEDERRRRQRLRVRRRRGMPVEPVGVDQGKALVYARLKLTAPGPGYVHFPQHPAFDDEYFAQLAAEKLVPKFRGHRPIYEWVPTRPRNEALDCFLLALAALRLSGMDLSALRAPSEADLPAEPAAAPQDDAEPQDPGQHHRPGHAPMLPAPMASALAAILARKPAQPAAADVAAPAAPPSAALQALLAARRRGRHGR